MTINLYCIIFLASSTQQSETSEAATSRLPFKMTVGEREGSRLLYSIVEKQLYRRQDRTKNWERWRCNLEKCKAVLVMRLSKEGDYLEKAKDWTPHNHPHEEATYRKNRFIQKLKDDVASSSESIRDIFNRNLARYVLYKQFTIKFIFFCIIIIFVGCYNIFNSFENCLILNITQRPGRRKGCIPHIVVANVVAYSESKYAQKSDKPGRNPGGFSQGRNHGAIWLLARRTTAEVLPRYNSGARSVRDFCLRSNCEAIDTHAKQNVFCRRNVPCCTEEDWLLPAFGCARGIQRSRKFEF